MEQLANEHYYVNKLTRDEFVRLFAELKADVLKVQDGAAVFGTAEDMLHDESKISEINRILKTQFDAADMPKTKAATVRGLLELTKDFTNEIITKQQKYVEAGRLSRKVRTLWRTLDDLVDKQDSVSDIHKTFEKLSRNDQNAIQAKRREYERLLNEFRALNPPPPIGSNPTIDNHIREQKKFLTLFQRFLQRAGIRPTVPPSVRSIPTVAIFDPRFTPQYFAIDERIAGTFANEAFCLSDLPVFQRYEDLCAAVDQPSKLTLAQQTPYYYSNPNNPTSILLNHSAGSGKTAAMTLACSLFVRAGYLPIIVTTEALAADTTYEKAVFIECADWNIQQLLQSNGRRNLIELVEETTSKPTVEQVIHSGRRLYRKMATTTNDDIWDPSLKMKFKDFSHMCRSILMGYKPSGIHGKILADRAPFINGKQNFLWKTVILMDEVQTMMDELPPTEGTFNYETTPFGDIRNVILALWAARRDTYEGPVVIAASATPGNSEFELAMILNLLCTESEGYKFTNRPYYKGWPDPSDPQAFTYEKEKPRLIKAFKAAHPDPKKVLARMALGRVSYYDSSASKSVPPMRVVPVHVELTGDQQTTQAKMLQKLATEIRLEQRADGSWEIQRDYGSQFMRGQTDHRKNSESLRTFTAQVKGNSIIAQTVSGNTIRGKVRNNGYFVPPKVKGGPDSVIRTREDYAKWKEIAPIISPLYTRTIDCLQMNKIRGIRKQYVYINLDSKAPQGSDLFCKMLGSLLRYNEVDRPTDGNVYNGNYARVTTSNLSTMLDLFNSAENQNGAVIDIIVLDRSTKEGVSLFGVGAVYIVGVMDSETDLVQSVARAFRNCRTDPSELYPPLHDVPVMLMTPFANDSPVHSILAEVNNANVKNDLKPDQMAEILKTASFDRDILRRENDAAMVANKKLTEFLKM